MKKLFSLLAVMLMLVFAFNVSSCKKDDDNTDDNTDSTTVLVEDGIYVVGPSIAFDEMKLDGQMLDGYVPGDNFSAQPKEDLYYKFLYVKAGDGFVIKEQAGANTIVYGLNGSWNKTEGDSIYVGSVAENGSNYTVASDGLYLLMFDKASLNVALMKINRIGLIGSAVGSWSDDKFMTQQSLDLTSGKWTYNDTLFAGEYKFRFNQMWDYPLTDANGDTVLTFFMNIAGSLDNLLPGGGDPNGPANLTIDQNGIYSVTLNWDIAKGFSATVEKTGDIFIDYSNVVISMIGSAFYTDNDPVNGTQTNWDVDMDMTGPTVDDVNHTYTYTYNGIYMIGGGEFKFRKDHDWGTNWGMGNITLQGDAASNFSGSDNIVVGSDGQYDVTFVFDGLSGDVTVTINASTK